MTATPEFRPPRERLVPPGGIEIFARDMTATIAADVPLHVVQTQLAEHNQWLPIDGDPALPVGDLVETNSTGPLRLGYGAWRDLLLGCQFTNGRGELITAGGRTVKNVAGYDLTKLMVGQQGLLAKIVTITTRTYQRPTGALAVTFEPDPRRLNDLLPTACRPQWAVLRHDALTCGYLGDDAALSFWESAVPSFKPRDVSRRCSLAQDVERRYTLFSRSDGDGSPFRAAVPPARLLEFAVTAGLSAWAADAAFGILRSRGAESALPALRQLARTFGGSLWRERGERIDDLFTEPVQRALLHRLRGAFQI